MVAGALCLKCLKKREKARATTQPCVMLNGRGAVNRVGQLGIKGKAFATCVRRRKR